MGNCCGAIVESGNAPGIPAGYGRSDGVQARWGCPLSLRGGEDDIQQDANRLRFDFNDGCSAALVATFAQNSGIDAHLERGADAAIDFADLSTRTVDFSTFQSALQDFQINQCIRLR